MIREWPTWNKRIKRGIGVTHPRFYASLKFVPRLRFDLYKSKSWAQDDYQWLYHISFGFLSFRVAIMKSCFAWAYYGTEKPRDMDKYLIVYEDTKDNSVERAEAHCYRHAIEIARDMPRGAILRGDVVILYRKDPQADYVPVYTKFFDGETYLRGGDNSW